MLARCGVRATSYVFSNWATCKPTPSSSAQACSSSSTSSFSADEPAPLPHPHPSGHRRVLHAGSAPRRISLFGAGANLLLSLYLLASYNLEIGGFQFVSENALFHAYGLSFSLGADGLSMVLLLLATLVTFAAVWVAPQVEKSPGMFYACLLFISGGAIGAFASIDLFFFYAFHELALIPTFLLIGIWGSGDRQRIAWKVTIYLAFGSFILLLGLIGLWLARTRRPAHF